MCLGRSEKHRIKGKKREGKEEKGEERRIGERRREEKRERDDVRRLGVRSLIREDGGHSGNDDVETEFHDLHRHFLLIK